MITELRFPLPEPSEPRGLESIWISFVSCRQWTRAALFSKPDPSSVRRPEKKSQMVQRPSSLRCQDGLNLRLKNSEEIKRKGMIINCVSRLLP